MIFKTLRDARMNGFELSHVSYEGMVVFRVTDFGRETAIIPRDLASK